MGLRKFSVLVNVFSEYPVMIGRVFFLKKFCYLVVITKIVFIFAEHNTQTHTKTYTKMEKLTSTQKITMATLKSFAKRNSDKLFAKTKSSFDGMTDGVEKVKDSFKPTTITSETGYYQTGIQGIYTVGSSRDYFRLYEDSKYIGIEVYNCCGTTILAIEKPVEMINWEKELLGGIAA